MPNVRNFSISVCYDDDCDAVNSGLPQELTSLTIRIGMTHVSAIVSSQVFTLSNCRKLCSYTLTSRSNSYDGYAPSIGSLAARNAIAERVSAVANSAIARSRNNARVTDSAEHNMTSEKSAVKYFRRSCTSSLTDSFSYENKRCDDSSDMSDCFDETACDFDSCFTHCDRNAEGVELADELSNHINGAKNDEYSKAELLARRCKFKSRYQQNMQITDSLPSQIRITGDDVIIASGCSSAVEMAISVLLNEGDNILVPR
jgi:hypothetical protein